MASTFSAPCLRLADPRKNVLRGTSHCAKHLCRPRGRLPVAAKAGIFQHTKEKAEDTGRKVSQAVDEHTPNPPHIHTPGWMPSLTNIVIFGAVAYGLSQTVLKKAPKGKNPADTVKKTAESVADKAPKPPQLTKPRPIDAARAVLAMESVGEEESQRLFSTADTNNDGKVDLRELTRAINKLQPPHKSSAEARDAAVDAFVLFGVNGAEGMNEEQFRRWLRSWCVLNERDLKDAVLGFNSALKLPDAKSSPEDKALVDELDLAFRSPGGAQRYFDVHKTGCAFDMWDNDRSGSIARDKVNKALLRMAQQLQNSGPGNKVLQATSIVELDAKMGPGSLDRRAFDNLIQRFAEQVGVSSGEVTDYLIERAMRKEQGEGPDPDRVMHELTGRIDYETRSGRETSGQHYEQRSGQNGRDSNKDRDRDNERDHRDNRDSNRDSNRDRESNRDINRGGRR